MLNTFTWSFACPAHCHPSVYSLSFLLACLGVSSLQSPCPFGFIGFSSVTSKSILHPSLPSQAEPNNLISCGHTCMSGLDRVAAAISGLAEAVRSLAFELGRARRPVTLETSEADLGECELIEEQSFVPGAPVGFNSTIKFQVEEGPPPTPDFLVSLAKKKLRSAADSTEDRVSNFARTSTCKEAERLWELSLLSASLQSLSCRSFALEPRCQFHPL